MKSILSTGLTAMFLTTAAATIALPGFAQQPRIASSEQLVAITTGDPQLDQKAPTPASIPTVPVITGSGVLGTNHFIRLAVYGMTLKDLMIALPAQMERFGQIQVLDRAGKTLPAQISINKTQVAITFDQPVTPGNAVQVLFTGVQMQRDSGETLFYGLTGKRVGLQGEIAIGTARVQVPNRD